ncbi:MAG: peptidoglycan-binding domain-containing protein, partial [Dehalococcoidia bacterium]|nr:peptidoglycan-binding domain-containing protein [Dehalococcoidia bacterium]
MNRKWTSVLALGLVGALIAGPVWGQSGTTPSTPSDATKSETKAGKAMARGGNREQVKAAQQALKDKGHDPGMIDGRMGSRTRAAVTDYQKAESLKVTGRLDDDT